MPRPKTMSEEWGPPRWTIYTLAMVIAAASYGFGYWLGNREREEKRDAKSKAAAAKIKKMFDDSNKVGRDAIALSEKCEKELTERTKQRDDCENVEWGRAPNRLICIWIERASALGMVECSPAENQTDFKGEWDCACLDGPYARGWRSTPTKIPMKPKEKPDGGS